MHNKRSNTDPASIGLEKQANKRLQARFCGRYRTSMSYRVGLIIITAMALISLRSYAISPEYREVFAKKVHAFAMRNRISQGNLNRDIHADCIIGVTLTITLTADGELKDIFVSESSTLPVYDRYAMWTVEQTSPFPPLKDYRVLPMNETKFAHTFYLDARVWDDNLSSKKRCKPIAKGH